MDKTSTHIYFFWIFLMLVGGTFSSGFWGSWSEWSACSRTCGGGVTTQSRPCVTNYNSMSTCNGHRVRHKICNNKVCENKNSDYRADQCTNFNNVNYGNRTYIWLPYTDRHNPCTLFCIPKGTRNVVKLASKVLDGTRCNNKNSDMCIAGICRKVGCDNKLDSNLSIDRCGVCGGNSSCIKNRKTERYQWIEIGLSPCSKTCGEGIQTYQYRCGDSLTGNQVPESRCIKSLEPKGRQKSCFRQLCPPIWKIHEWRECSASCDGGHTTRVVRCTETLKDGKQQWLHDSFCPRPKPMTTDTCNTHACPKWFPGQWSPCSATCGWGVQKREVLCRHNGKVYCKKDEKPINHRNCTAPIPCLELTDPRQFAYQDEQTVRTSGQFEELVYGTGELTEELHVDDLDKYNMTSPRFVVSSWSPCSATCGDAFQMRSVTCVIYHPYLKDIVELGDGDCPYLKPEMRRSCKVDPCYKDYQWVPRGMSQCSRSCLKGTQETLLECVHKRNHSTVDDKNCQYSEKIPIERRVCNDFPCPQRWRIGDFDDCSRTCGGGMMIRDVRCIQQIDISLDVVVDLPDVMCNQPIPQRVRECNTQLCPADWASGFWSTCSATCGQGVQLRPVVCQRVTPNGEPVDVDEYHCPPSEKPASKQLCNQTKCPEIKIKAKNVKFFQINKMGKVRLVVGAEAAVLPGTSIVVRCPVRGFNKAKLEWLKNGQPLRRNRRVVVSNRGNLRIRRSSPERDTGEYTCVAHKKSANIKISFSDIYAIMKETVPRQKYLSGYLNDESSPNSSITLMDPFDRKPRPLSLVVREWSSCSATCGGGIRKRKVTCEIITNDYFEVFPIKKCKNVGLSIPDSVEKCSIKDCTRWVKKDWSSCLSHKCVREGYSIKLRTVGCMSETNSSLVYDKTCDSNLRPVSRKECRNPLCKPKWNTSEWSDCLAPCGEIGFQSRILTCIWENSKQPARRACEGMPRPVLTRDCFNKCTNGCTDASDYCSIVPMMNLCRYINFKTKCCHSCSNYTEDQPS